MRFFGVIAGVPDNETRSAQLCGRRSRFYFGNDASAVTLREASTQCNYVDTVEPCAWLIIINKIAVTNIVINL